MLKKLLFTALSLLCIPLLKAQNTKVVPDCVIPFNFTATGSTSNLTCGAPNGTPNSPGIASWILVYENTGYSVLSLVVQSAPDNAGAPGSWGTFAGTVLSSTQVPGSSGINPNTAITSAFTGFAGYYPWMRVTLASVTGTGRVKGNLYGYLNSNLAKGGGGGGSVTPCGGAIAGQVTVFASGTTICGIVQSAFDAAAVNTLVRLGPPDSSLPFFLPGYTFGQTLLVTQDHSSGNKAAIGIESHGAYGLFAVNITDTGPTSIGMETDAYTGTPGGTGYGAYHFIGSLDGSTPGGLYGVTAFPQIGDGSTGMPSTVPNLWGFYRYTPAFLSGSTLTTDQAFFAEAMGGKATNAYPQWFDERGVYAVHSINTFNSVYQARPALYNPQFTKYTPGATNQERFVYQWASNVAQVGTENGGTGTLRDVQMIGNRWLYKTAAPGTNTTEVASTAFVQAAVTAGACPTCLTATAPASDAILKGTGTQAVTASGVSIDGSNNLSTPGSITSGSGSGVAGIIDLAQGTAPSIPANSFGFVAPTVITTSEYLQPPDAVPAAHSTLIVNAPTGNISPFSYKVVPDCQDTGGDHLNFTQSTDTFSCGTSGGGGGSSAGATLFSTTSSTTVTATSPTTLIGAGTGTTTIAANTFTAGQTLEFVAQGFYSTPATPASLTIAYSIGGTARITTGAVVQIASVTNGVWRVRCMVTTRTTGASGTQIANCIFEGTGVSLTPGEAPMQTSSTWTMDTTATQVIDLLATWSTTTGAPTITSTNVAAWIPGAPVTSVNGMTGAVTVAGSSITQGTFAALPATCTTGDLYFFTTGVYDRARCSATNTWSIFYQGVIVTPPSNATFTWLNQGTSTASYTNGYGILTPQSAGALSARVQHKAIPVFVTNVTLDIAYRGTAFAASCFGGIEIDDGTKLLSSVDVSDTAVQWTQWTTTTNNSGNFYNQPGGRIAGGTNWNRIILDATNITLYISSDGINYDLVVQNAKAGFLTAQTNWGWLFTCNTPVGHGQLVHFKETVN